MGTGVPEACMNCKYSRGQEECFTCKYGDNDEERFHMLAEDFAW